MNRRRFLSILGALVPTTALASPPRCPKPPQAPPVRCEPVKPKSGLKYDPDHRCDNCGFESSPGTGTWIVRGSTADGGHTHQCPKCGQMWQHGGTHSHAAPEPTMQYTLPGTSSGCANGQCPTSVSRRGILRR